MIWELEGPAASEKEAEEARSEVQEAAAEGKESLAVEQATAYLIHESSDRIPNY